MCDIGECTKCSVSNDFVLRLLIMVFLRLLIMVFEVQSNPSKMSLKSACNNYVKWNCVKQTKKIIPADPKYLVAEWSLFGCTVVQSVIQ